MRALLLPLFLALPLLAAPAPRPRPEKPFHITPGRWKLTWGGAVYQMVLWKDGGCVTSSPPASSYSENSYPGTWSYDRSLRKFWVQELIGEGNFTWEAVLDKDRVGQVKIGKDYGFTPKDTAIEVKLEPWK